MAVKRLVASTSLQLEVQNGVDSDGNAKYTKKSFSGLKANAADEDILAVGQAIGDVLLNGANAVYVNSTALVVNQE